MTFDRGARVVPASEVLSDCFTECYYAGSETPIRTRHWHCPCGCGPTTQKRKNVKICASCETPCIRAEYSSAAGWWVCRRCKTRRTL